jgi:hypothetical protein
VNAENILNAARGVLERRGRCIGDFELGDGRVDQLGALAIAGGEAPDIWRFWRDFETEDLDGHALTLVEAARLLAEVEAPLQPVREMSIERLVMLLGDSSDIATDAQIDDFLTQAASLAARTEVAA